MEDRRIAVFTICSLNYLAKALALAESVFAIDGIKIMIFIADAKRPLAEEYGFADIRWLEDEGIDGYRELAFIYDVTEFNTCLKPFIALRLLADSAKVLFLDPDTYAFSSLKTVFGLLDRNPILLTPHYLTPIDDPSKDYDLGMMRFGSFNLGFFAVNGDGEARAFLEWWSKRCMDLCFFETQFGLSTDQKWVSIAPCFFPNLKVLFDPGLNMAFWNMHERRLGEKGGRLVVNGEAPLVFFHFSAFDHENPKRISKRLGDEGRDGRNDLDAVCEAYSAAVSRFDRGYSGLPYAYDYMDDGMYISPTLRRAYACMRGELALGADPFSRTGKMRSFIDKNGLRPKDNKRYASEGAADKGRHSKGFAIAYLAMRGLLRAIGPNAFTNFSRLLVYLSSYRQNRGLWKL